MMRRRKKSDIYGVEIIKQLDSFPKVIKDDFVERSRIGGIVSVIANILILWILYNEIYYYLLFDVDFKFTPDTQYDEKLPVNLDMIVAMPCSIISADILDSTDQHMDKFGALEMEDTWFEMTPEQETFFRDMQHYNSYLREEYHAINHFLWRSGHSFHNKGLPKRYVIPSHPPDACRVFGTLVLNKVAGNLHVTAGTTLSVPGQAISQHIHFSAYIPQAMYNFSHRILHLSFGDSRIGIINPLDGDEKIAESNTALYQYFIEVVPTDVNRYFYKAKTYQYSVQDNLRIISHSKGSHGVPGIFFKYDVSALKIVVVESNEPPLDFYIRLSSLVAGVYVIAGFVKNIIEYIIRKIDPPKYDKPEKIPVLNENDGVII